MLAPHAHCLSFSPLQQPQLEIFGFSGEITGKEGNVSDSCVHGVGPVSRVHVGDSGRSIGVGSETEHSSYTLLLQCLVKGQYCIYKSRIDTSRPNVSSYHPKTAGGLTRKRASANHLTSSTSATSRTSQTPLFTVPVSRSPLLQRVHGHNTSHPRRFPASLTIHPCACLA